MSFLVRFYRWNKPDNSFRKPDSSTASYDIYMQLKAPCSISNPVLEYTGQPETIESINSFSGLTYAYIPEFVRYYFVSSPVLDGNIVRVQLKVDVLATAKDAILSHTCYVLRSASNYDGFIKDTQYPIKASDPYINGYQAINPLSPSINNPTGIYVLGIVNATGSITGSVSYYAFTSSDCQYFMQQLFNLTTQWGSGGSDIADGLKKAITDPMQYIVSSLWFPWDMQDLVNQNLVVGTQYVYVGYDSITLNGYAGKFVDKIGVEITNVITIQTPRHPLDTSRGNYMNYEPFSRYYLCFYPFCGLLELDSTRLKGYTYLVYTVDLRSGRGILNVTGDYTGASWADWRASAPQRVIEAQVGVQVPLASIHTALQNVMSTQFIQNAVVSAANEFGGFEQTGRKIVNTLSSGIMSGIAKLTGSKELQDAVNESTTTGDVITSQDISSIASNAAAMKSTLEMIGAQGTLGFYDRQAIMLWGAFYTPVDDDVTRFGRPLCKSVLLNTLSGFVLCDNPHLAITGITQEELAIAEQYLRTGAYIE